MDDVLAVCNYIRGRSDLAPLRMIICGYSYGSIIAGAVAAEIPELAGIISISYPCGGALFLIHLLLPATCDNLSPINSALVLDNVQHQKVHCKLGFHPFNYTQVFHLWNTRQLHFRIRLPEIYSRLAS